MLGARVHGSHIGGRELIGPVVGIRVRFSGECGVLTA